MKLEYEVGEKVYGINFAVAGQDERNFSSLYRASKVDSAMNIFVEEFTVTKKMIVDAIDGSVSKEPVYGYFLVDAFGAVFFKTYPFFVPFPYLDKDKPNPSDILDPNELIVHFHGDRQGIAKHDKENRIWINEYRDLKDYLLTVCNQLDGLTVRLNSQKVTPDVHETLVQKYNNLTGLFRAIVDCVREVHGVTVEVIKMQPDNSLNPINVVKFY